MRSDPETLAIAAAALGELGGAALVLDDELKIQLATPEATALIGFDLPLGASAPKLLCGARLKRPVAESLVAGKPIQTLIPHPGSPDAKQLLIRSVPLGGATRKGWLLLLQNATTADSDGAVSFHGMWTQDAAMKEVFRIVERVAEDDAPVLVRGETGAGKELVAQAIHDLSSRKKGPFRAINCAALPPALLESELFGHVRGAFTGAVRDAPGHMQMASGGTLFLDEVAELPLEMQAKLLRAIETHTVLPVGARDAIPVDVRIVSATHRALRREVEAGRFRADLMYRLRVIPIFLPPLRERRGDVALLVEKVVEELNAKGRRRVDRVSPAALEVLEGYDFPGNVRELRNLMIYAFAIGSGPVLVPSDLPREVFHDNEDLERDAVERSLAPEAETAPRSPEAQRIVDVLSRTGGSRERAAKVLGWSRVTLWRRMRELGLVKS